MEGDINGDSLFPAQMLPLSQLDPLPRATVIDPDLTSTHVGKNNELVQDVSPPAALSASLGGDLVTRVKNNVLVMAQCEDT
jgi:hypothetical protein